MPKAHAVRIERTPGVCFTLEQLYEETRLLYDAITAEARRGRLASKPRRQRKVTPKTLRLRSINR
jgi:hypothetical protein